MDDYFSSLDFFAINGYPHDLPEKAIEKLPSFQGNNAVSAKSHPKAFYSCINKWCSGAAHNQGDVKMKLFVFHWKKMLLIGFLGWMTISMQLSKI
jgi:hypothetical protein